MPRFRIGCTGWSYDFWRGPFYPAGTPPGEYLERYARVFDVAEVDSTYYRVPSRSQVQSWATRTPTHFTFMPKLPKDVTHEGLIGEDRETLNRFLQVLEPLSQAGKLGPLVVQLPPRRNFDDDFADLGNLLIDIPDHHQLAVELRHPSWWREETFDVLREREAALVWSETPYADVPPEVTAPFVYTRLIGDWDLDPKGRVERDQAPALQKWTRRLREETRGVDEVYVLLNNHFQGFAPETARQVASMLDVEPPDLTKAARGEAQHSLAEFG